MPDDAARLAAVIERVALDVLHDAEAKVREVFGAAVAPMGERADRGMMVLTRLALLEAAKQAELAGGIMDEDAIALARDILPGKKEG